MKANTQLQAALDYAERGWHVFPCWPGTKKPITKTGLKEATTDPERIRQWWTRTPDANIAMACGPGSGIYVVDVDLDTEKKINGWESLKEFPDLPMTIRQDTPRGGAHFLFRTDDPPRNKNAFREGIDVRCEGYYIMLSPSVHPNGKVYKWARDQGPGEIEPAEFPNAFRPPTRPKSLPWETNPPALALKPVAGPEKASVIERARLYLPHVDAAVQGAGGHDALFWAARVLVWGFDLDEATALSLLWSDFNPRCTPPWNHADPADRKDLERKVSEANTAPYSKPRGWLLDECGLRDIAPVTNFNIEGSVKALTASLKDSPAVEVVEDEDESEDTDQGRSDPGPIPDSLLFEVPGFVRQFIDCCMEAAPYPNAILAGGAALAVQSFLASRKLRDASDVRPNIYLCALASSGTGKDAPRKLAKEVLFDSGFRDAIGEKFASGPGIEDALLRTPAKLYLVDELDTLMRQVGASRPGDVLSEEMNRTLLTFFSNSNSRYHMRDKAGQEVSDTIKEPHFVLFGTAIPKNLYASFTERTISNGLLSRCLLLEAGSERFGQDGRPMIPSDDLLETASWWNQFTPGGDLASVNPTARIVETMPEAKEILGAFRYEAERKWRETPEEYDAKRGIYARAPEYSKKMALLYAASRDHQNPIIDTDAADWAVRFMRHHVGRLLAMVGRFGANSLFEQECQKILDRIRHAGKRGSSRSELLRFTKMNSRDFSEHINTLLDREDIRSDQKATKGRVGIVYFSVARSPRRP